jgi:hypothetical protein
VAEEVAEAVSAAVVAEAALAVAAVRPLVPQTLFLVSLDIAFASHAFFLHDC